MNAANIAAMIVVFSGVVSGQPQPTIPASAIRLSGRITDSKGAPMANRSMEFHDLTVLYRIHNADQSTSTTTTSSDGGFSISIQGHDEYAFLLIDPEDPDPADPIWLNIGQIVAVGGQDIDLGKIVLKTRTKETLGGSLVGPVTVTPISTQSKSEANVALSMAAIFIGADGPCILRPDGKVLRPQNEPGQVGNSSVQISQDRTAVGWLAEFPFCCASYPLAYALVVYRPGKPLRRFTGDGRAIFRWYFVGGGKQVAFNQSFPHGDLQEHYELRDVETERLIDKWDGDLTTKAPKWTKGMPP